MTPRFEVTEIREFWQGDELVARYHPGFAYRLTDRNKWFAISLIDQGLASLVDDDRMAEIDAKNGISLSSRLGRVSGTLQVGA
jgi:hypothetical protein